MSAIRPDLPSSLPATGVAGQTAQAKAAQAAFFRAAMGMSAPTPAAAPVETRADTPVRSVQTQEASGTMRYQRPGSLLDIRV